MIRTCRCLPRLAGRQSSTGSLRDSNEGPGPWGADAVSAMLQCRGSKGPDRTRKRNGFYTALVACAWTWTLENFLSKNTRGGQPTPPSLASSRACVTRRGPSSLAAARATCAAHASAAASALFTLRDRGGPPSLAAAKSLGAARRQLQRLVSLAAACSHSPSTAHLTYRSQSHSRDWSVTDSVIRSRLTDSVTRHCCCAKAEVCIIVQIWNTLIAIFGATLSPYFVYS